MAARTDYGIQVTVEPVFDQIPRLCAVSLFRPKERNNKYRLYYDSLLQFARRFKIIFKDFILRVYYDDSLFSKDYTYKDKDDEGWDGHTEDYYWSHLLCVLKGMKHVQLAHVVWEAQLEDDKVHHKGLIGTLFRFHAMVDTTVNVAVIRDIDGNVFEADYNSINEWITTKDTQMHYYYSKGYNPKHYQNNTKLLNVLKENQRPFVSASMFATKRLDPIKKTWIWKIIRDMSETLVPNYGNDEIILNWIIHKQFLAIDVTAVKTWDFYIGENKKDAKDNIWWNFKNNGQNLSKFKVKCSDNYHFQFDLEKTPPPKNDEEGTVNYAGYLTNIVHQFFKDEERKIEYIFWDQILGDIQPLFTFEKYISVNGIRLRVDTIDELWNVLEHTKQEYNLLLSDGSILDEYSVLDYAGKEILELTLQKIKINEFSDMCCSICSTPNVAYSCVDCGQVFCKDHKILF